VLIGDEDAPLQEDESRENPLHHLADLADPFDCATHVKQLILAKLLIDVNAVSIPQGTTPLYTACYFGNVTNLDFVEYLLEEGADPNAQDHMGRTSLIYTIPDAPGAAKFLLNWPTTDVNIITQSGECFIVGVLLAITFFSDKAALPDNPDQVQHQFLL
jgi:hypothetical protein